MIGASRPCRRQPCIRQPEDCGGPPGYADMLEILADPGNPEGASMREWVGADFDRARFDIAAVNAALCRR